MEFSEMVIFLYKKKLFVAGIFMEFNYDVGS